jgi:hypothetical protein
VVWTGEELGLLDPSLEAAVDLDLVVQGSPVVESRRSAGQERGLYHRQPGE